MKAAIAASGQSAGKGAHGDCGARLAPPMVGETENRPRLTARLTMICCAGTAAARRAAFAHADEPLPEGAIAQAAALAPNLPRASRTWTSPELRARQTADALGLEATPRADLRDMDFGRWVGMSLADLHGSDPAGLGAALADPQAAPHGGESVAGFCARVASVMQDLLAGKGGMVAVTHPAVIRAAVLHALGAPAQAFWRIDVEPLSQVRFTSDGRRWALRMTGPA
jgi:broad specificity phosphatase PhoE